MNDSSRPDSVRVLCLGDVVARPGRQALKALLPGIQEQYRPNLTIVNGENASGGTGLEADEAKELLESGADVLTLGDHTWRYQSIHSYLEDVSFPLLRPANYPSNTPGKEYFIIEKEGRRIGIINLLGRVFVDGMVDCPFQKAEMLLEGPLKDCDIRICDFHAEATSEKIAFAKCFDGKFSLIYGTHTHVPTADPQVLPQGTGYVTDLGMCGSPDGVIGLATEVALTRFTTSMHAGYKAASGQGQLSGIVADIGTDGKATKVFRVDTGL